MSTFLFIKNNILLHISKNLFRKFTLTKSRQKLFKYNLSLLFNSYFYRRVEKFYFSYFLFLLKILLYNIFLPWFPLSQLLPDVPSSPCPHCHETHTNTHKKIKQIKHMNTKLETIKLKKRQERKMPKQNNMSENVY